jgi:alkanesulfonate monooxygenase SsuD/methylene tetrahydromethanopterin reductase-like flavin-dependent oxidoreductase (luciferase family)
MVCSVTFRHPSMLAKMAADVSVLSNGRFDMGLGAGWFEGEHRMFGIDFPKYLTRLEMLDEEAADARFDERGFAGLDGTRAGPIRSRAVRSGLVRPGAG